MAFSSIPWGDPTILYYLGFVHVFSSFPNLPFSCTIERSTALRINLRIACTWTLIRITPRLSPNTGPEVGEVGYDRETPGLAPGSDKVIWSAFRIPAHQARELNLTKFALNHRSPRPRASPPDDPWGGLFARGDQAMLGSECYHEPPDVAGRAEV